MNICTSNSDLPLGFSKSQLIRKPSQSEKELLESLTNEINELVKDANRFEHQYKSILNYYHQMAKDTP